MLILSRDGTLTLGPPDCLWHYCSPLPKKSGPGHAPSGMKMQSLCLKQSSFTFPCTPTSVGAPQASRQNTQNSHLHLFISISFINLHSTFRTNRFYVPSVFSICVIFTHSFYKYLLTITSGPDPGFGSVVNTKRSKQRPNAVQWRGFGIPIAPAFSHP